MRKTFLKVALIGLLAAAMPSTFTSCKDYDDDITNLTNQTNDLKTQLASVNAAIAALPTKADVSAAQAAAVAQAKSDLNAVKAQLEAAIAGKADKATVDAIQTELSTIKGQLEALEALKVELGTTITDLSNSIKDLQENAVTKGQMETALEAQKAQLDSIGGSVATLSTDVAALQAALDQANTNNAAEIAAIKTQLEELAGKIGTEQPGAAAPLESVLRLLNGMITHIAVVTNGDADFDTQLNLFTVAVTEDLVFGEGLPGEITFKKGEEQQFTDELLVRVSPANAVVTADQIQIVNSKGEDMSQFITVTEVTPFEGLLTRSIANNGLHVVKLELNKDIDSDAYSAATSTKQGDVLFAVAIADSDKDLAAGREITSAYDVTIKSEAPDPQYTLLYTANKKDVTEIHNRFVWADGYDQTPNGGGQKSSFAYAKSLVGGEAQNKVSMEDAYKYGTTIANFYYNQFYNVGDFAYQTNNKNVVIKTIWDNANDNRQDKPSLNVQLGQKIPVELTGDNVDGIYGMYIALDLLRATESNGSEAAAWKSYESKISGINEVVKGTSTNIVLGMDDVEAGEIIGFRVWAVNYNGTLVDPDGRAFYVQVGQAEAPAEASAAFTVVAATNNNVSATKVTIADQLSGDWMNKLASVDVVFTLDKNQAGSPDIQINFGTGTSLNSWYPWIQADQKYDSANPNVADGTIFRDPAKGYAPAFTDMTAKIYGYGMVDGQAYTGKLKIMDGTNVLQTIAISVTKTLPTAMPANTIAAKPGQVTDGKINGYIDADGAIDLTGIFTLNDPNNNLSEVLTFAANNKVDAVNNVLAGLDAVKVSNKLIVNNGTFYTLTFKYNYGNISYVGKEDENGDMQYSYKNVTIPATYQMSVNTLTNAYNLAWGTYKEGNTTKSYAPVLVQDETPDAIPFSHIFVTSSVQTLTDKTLANVGVTVTKVETDGNIKSYFEVDGFSEGDTSVQLKPITANPVGEISGTLKITYKGDDGVLCVKTLTLTMNKK